MKAPSRLAAGRLLLTVLLMVLVALVGGCTPALWNKETFAHHYRPAVPNHLHLFYSKERNDVLVQYDESKDADTLIQPRWYWLERNTLRVNDHRKPHFTSAKATNGLTLIPVTEEAAEPTQSGLKGLYAVAPHDEAFFTLYASEEKLDPYQLPAYTGPSQRVKQVLLTPFAVAVDVTIVGGVIAYFSAPGILESLSR